MIIAEQNYSKKDTTEPKATRLHWSEAVFQGYKNVVGADTGKLAWIFQFSVTQHQIIDEARIKLHVADDKTLDVNLQNAQEVFFALLGSDNGIGIAYILIDHGKALGHKNIKSIRVAPKSGAIYIMYFESGI